MPLFHCVRAKLVEDQNEARGYATPAHFPEMWT